MPGEQTIIPNKQRHRLEGSGTIGTGTEHANGSRAGSGTDYGTSSALGRSLSNPDMLANAIPSLELLHQQVQAATSPFGGSHGTKPTTETPNSHEHTLKYFLALTTFFPAAVAVLTPADMWNNNGTDLANMFTNTVVVLLLAWAIKFSVEWPWKWLKKIKLIKATLIGYANASLQNQEPNFATLVQLLRRTVYFENVALLACLIVPLLGSGLMWGGRNYITVDEHRKKLVFNNLNIVLFESWLALRWTLSMTDSWHKSYDTPGDILTENNLSGLFQEESSSPIIGSFSSTMRGFTVEPEFKLEINSSNHDQFSEKLASLESKSEDQRRIMDSLLGFQEKEYSSIVSYLTKLEKTILELSHSSSINSPKVDSGVFVKPFPLNLKLESEQPKLKIPASSTLRIQALDTISEVESLEESISPASSPVAESFNDENAELKSPLPKRDDVSPAVGQDDYQKPLKKPKPTYSLHGLPASSTLKHIITNKLIYTDDTMEIEQTLSHEHDTSVSDLSSLDRTQPMLMKEFLHIAHYLKENVTIYKFIKNPWKVIGSIYTEFRTQLLRSQLLNIAGIQQQAGLYNLVFWNLMNHYVLENSQQVVQYFEHVRDLLIRPLVRLCKIVLFLSLRIPLNALKLWVSLQLLIPKVLFKVFILYPFLVVRSRLSKDKPEAPPVLRPRLPREISPLGISNPPLSPNFPVQSPSSELPFGMKKFRLSPSLSPNSQFASDYFDNGHSNHFKVENGPVPVFRKPVTGRSGTTFHRVATPVIIHTNQREVY